MNTIENRFWFEFTKIDPDIQGPYSDEFNLGVERELMPNLALGVTHYRRHNRRLISGINLAVPPSSYTGLADRVITNIEGLEHDYNGLELTITKRMRKGQPDLTSPGGASGTPGPVLRPPNGEPAEFARRRIRRPGLTGSPCALHS